MRRKTFSIKPGDHFDMGAPQDIRLQIMTYGATSHMTDTERARFLGLPEGCRIREGAKILSPENLKLGKFCWIGEGAVLDASGGLSVGEHTSIGLSVFLWTHDSHSLNLMGENVRTRRDKILRKPTVVGTQCFIAGPSVVMPGVKIGDRCIISAMSVVYEDLPDGTIYKPYRRMMKESRKIEQISEALLQTLERVTSVEKELLKLRREVLRGRRRT